MAQAIIRGGLIKGLLESGRVNATDIAFDKIKSFSDECGISICSDNRELVRRSQVIVLATKPQDIAGPLKEISDEVSSRHTVISIAAGVPSSVLKKYLGKAQALARVMPNTPALVQRGLFGLYIFQGEPDRQKAISSFFEGLGKVVRLRNDRQVDAVTAGSASGVGFVFHFMEEFEKWFRKKGFSPEDSRRLCEETFLGSAYLSCERKELTLKRLREAVTSKKGTTEAGFKVFQKRKVAAGLQAGLEAAFLRAQEIAKNLRPK